MHNSSSRLHRSRHLLYKVLFILTAAISVYAAAFTLSASVSDRLPATICLRENESKTIDFDIPMTASMEIMQSSSVSNVSVRNVKAVNFHEPVSFIAGEAGEYHINVKLMGLFLFHVVSLLEYILRPTEYSSQAQQNSQTLTDRLSCHVPAL